MNPERISSQLHSISSQHRHDDITPVPSIRSSNLFLDHMVCIRNMQISKPYYSQKEDNSAIIIQKFMRKMIAAQSYGKMFANGSNFNRVGHNMLPYKGKASFAALDHLDTVSKYYLKEIKNKVTNLTLQEQQLLSRIINTKMTLRHQSNSYLALKNQVTIYSHDKLVNEKIASGKHTYLCDKQALSNHDFVFFGVEFSENKNEMPLNHTHMTIDFGAYAYLIEDKFLHGYLTLTDHFDNRMPTIRRTEHKRFASQFRQALKEVHRDVHGDKGQIDIPIFNSKDMKLALGLHIIDFLRQSHDMALKKFAFKETLTGKELDRLINFIFQPELHLPRMVSTRDYTEVKLREMTLREAIGASNFERIYALIKDKDTQCRALGVAVYKTKKDVIVSLFKHFRFTPEDVPFIRESIFSPGLLHILSDFYSCLSILKLFVEKGLINVNATFVVANQSITMLDNVIKYNKADMIAYLRSVGARTSAELREENNQDDIRECIEDIAY